MGNIVMSPSPLAKAVAPVYDSSVSYAVGDYCTKGGKIYKCIESTTGTFDSTKWTEVLITDELENIEDRNTLTKTIDTPAAIQTFTDGAEWPMSMEIAIDPVQDLHGYANPWPGGATKNKFSCPFTSGRTIDGSGTVGTTSQRSATIDGIAVSENTQYTLSYNGSGKFGRFFYNSNDEFLSYETWENQGTFTTPANTAYVRFSYNSETVPTSVQLEEGSTATSYIPYSNICPITGWDGANVAANGKNWCPIKLDKLKELNTAGTWSENVYTRTGIKFTVNADDQGNVTSIVANGTASADWVTLRLFNNTLFRAGSYEYTGITNGSLTTYRITLAIDDVDLPVFQSGTYSIEQDKDFLLHSDFIIRMSGYVANNVTIYPMIRLVSETDTTFEPYKGATYPITFPSSAGTVYGGTLTVHADGTGELVVDREFVDLGSLTWTMGYNNTIFRAVSPSNTKYYAATGLPAICSCYPNAIGNDFNQFVQMDKVFELNNSGYSITTKYIIVRDTSVPDAATFQSNMTGQKLVYELDTPTVIPLSIDQVLSILGKNYVWADCGNINKISYVRRQDIGFIREDTAGQIKAATDPIKEEQEDTESSLAIVIDGDTAPKAITSGQYLFIKNHSTLARGLYHATSAILSGASITSNNTSPDPDGVANAINANIPEVVDNLTTQDATKALSAAQGYSLNSKIGGYNYTSGTMVDITTYNSLNNYYTCPTNGYVRVEKAGDSITIGDGGAQIVVATDDKRTAIYVPKGTKIVVAGSGGYGTNAVGSRFVPLY